MENQVKDVIIDFIAIFWEAMPFIVLGAVISGILEELVPQQLISRLVPKNTFLAVALSALLGLVFPMCECGIVPVMRRLLRKGLPLSCCIAYMLAGPIINVVVILSTTVAFSPHVENGGRSIIVLRMVLGYFVALGTAMVVHRLYRKHGNDLLTAMARPDKDTPGTKSLTVVSEGPPVEPKRTAWKRIGAITETTLHDFTDITVFLTIGAFLAAMSRQMLSHEDIQRLSNQYPPLAILAMMGLAIVMCLCSEADAFVAASFTKLDGASKLAFLVLGPMLDFKLYLLFTRVFKPKLIWTIITCLIVQVFVWSMIVHYTWPQIREVEARVTNLFVPPTSSSVENP